ncbi:MAG: alpha-E domain-containing protein, partial [Alphaproteobacteria bacterium]|nr:alpha-E domain-containing protein [Alphaproteobacteria bacterium]
MLGRTANSLFWMFRYLERAENTARLLDAGLRMALTRDSVSAEEEWRSVIETAGHRRGYEAKNATYTGMQAWNYILRDKDSSASVLNTFKQIRSNAREARSAITSEVWEAVNDSWLQIKDMLARPVGEQRVGEVLTAVRRAGTLAHGAVLGSMLREEGFHFARAGTFIERADNIAR